MKHESWKEQKMATHEQSHPLAGQKVSIKQGVRDPVQGQVVADAEYRIEDWADRLFGQSIWSIDRNPAILQYAARIGLTGGGIAADDECVYGKIGSLGHIVHVSEFEGADR
jgi:hypothetical protein